MSKLNNYNFSKCIIRFFIFVLFLLLSLFILRDIIFSSFFIGFNHDQNFPMTNDMLRTYCTRAFYIWHNDNGGSVYIYPAENLLKFLLYPFSLINISGLTIIKLIYIFIFSFSGYSMYLFLKEIYKFTIISSFISGIFYMTTPLLFNKIAAGHVPYIISYALSPFIIYLFIKYINKSNISNFIAVSMFLSFISIQIQFIIMMMMLLFFYAIIVLKIKLKNVIYKFIYINLFVILINSFWIIPTILEYSSFSTTIKSTIDISDLKNWGTSFLNAFRMIGYRSPHFETVLNNSNYKNIWDISSLLIVIIVFSTLLLYKNRIVLYFGIVSVFILIIVTITGPFETFVYHLYTIIPFSNVFREVYHLVFLISISYTIILAFFIQKIYHYKKYFNIISIFSVLILVLINGIFLYTGNFSGQVQQYQFNQTNLDIISKYTNSTNNYRILYVPTIQPFKYDNLTYNGIDPIIEYSLKPTIGNYVWPEFLRRAIIETYTPSADLINIFNLLSIKYIIFRKDLQSTLPSYLNEGKLSLGNESYDIRSIWTNNNLNKTLTNQLSQNLVLSYNSPSLSVFMNNNSLPRIYPATIPIAINGNIDKLFILLSSSTINNLDNEAIFLSKQLNQNQWQFIKGNNNTCIVDESLINVRSYNGSEKLFNWRTIANDTLEARYYTGWKSIIRTDGQENESTLSFSSPAVAPYEFSPMSPRGWVSFNSTLIYIKTGDVSFRIDQIFENGKQLVDVVVVWWETSGMGMVTRPVQYPIVIPPNQRAIIQFNHIITDNVTFQSLGFIGLSPDEVKLNKPPVITFNEVNPTKYEIKIENATHPFFVVFNENYDPQWRAYVGVKDLPSVEVGDEYHFIVNGYSNAWYINPEQIDGGTEQFTVVLYYFPQNYYYLGLLTTGITIFSCFIYLLYARIWNNHFSTKLSIRTN